MNEKNHENVLKSYAYRLVIYHMASFFNKNIGEILRFLQNQKRKQPALIEPQRRYSVFLSDLHSVTYYLKGIILTLFYSPYTRHCISYVVRFKAVGNRDEFSKTINSLFIEAPHVEYPDCHLWIKPIKGAEYRVYEYMGTTNPAFVFILDVPAYQTMNKKILNKLFANSGKDLSALERDNNLL